MSEISTSTGQQDSPQHPRAQGSVAREAGERNEDRVFRAILDLGLKNVDPKQLGGIAGNDGPGLLNAGLDLLREQEDYAGVVVRELPCDCSFTFASRAGKQSNRDFVMAFAGGRHRAGSPRDLVIQVEAKMQTTGGSVDEKAAPTIENVFAGRAPYAFVVWEGDGPKTQSYDLFYEACTNPEPIRQRLRSMTWGKPDHEEGPTQFFFAATLDEFLQQVKDIREAEARGETLTYNEWLSNVPRPAWFARRTGDVDDRVKAPKENNDTHTLPLF